MRGRLPRARLEAGEELHPTQGRQVTEALLAGGRTPLWEGGRELKAQVFPDRFSRWFGLTLATRGQAAVLVFPRVEAGAVPVVEGRGRVLGDGDFMSGATEDRYPDVLGLVREVARRLAGLPHHDVVLGHDPAANADLPAKATGCAWSPARGWVRPPGGGRPDPGERRGAPARGRPAKRVRRQPLLPRTAFSSCAPV